MSNTCMTGFDGKMYYNDTADTTSAGAGTYEVPVWVEITLVKDVTINTSADKIDDTDRGSQFKKYCAGQFDLECTASLSYRNGNTQNEVIREAHLDRTSLDIAVLDGSVLIEGTEGFRFISKVFSHDWDQPMTDIMMVDVTLAPTYAADSSGDEIEPTWNEVTASGLVPFSS